jgi:hypothetical protein
MSKQTQQAKTSEQRTATSRSGDAGCSATAALAPPAYGIDILDRMGRFFGQDFSGVQIQPDSPRAPALGARAYTQGESIHFASGQYQPDPRQGRELIGHELAHVVQQRQGRVEATATLGSGMALNDSPELEREADRAGRLAAQSPEVAAPVVQRMCDACGKKREDEEKRPVQRYAVQGPIQMARASLSSGPKYNPSGDIDAPDPGGGALQQADFRFTALFENKPNLNVLPGCGEIRQEIMWNKKEDIDGHGVLDNKLLFAHNRWYEDRDSNDERYGHRADAYTDGTVGIDAFHNADGTHNQATGVRYRGRDTPGSTIGGLKGKWKFRLKAIDTCNHDAQIGDYDYVTVNWGG